MDRKDDRPPADQARRPATPPRLTEQAAEAQAARQKRLAAALRANLGRRKAAGHMQAGRGPGRP
ncbi:MAG: hypothetical protein IT556_08880 [Acetobacteraceae bacterium]|nr:hypothetical protein [Acetobacteraceae bacterium]